MSLPKDAIEQFKKIYKKLYKVELSDEEASHRANNLVSLYKATASRPTRIKTKMHEVVSSCIFSSKLCIFY